MSPSSLQLVSEFCKLVDEEKNYREASSLLHQEEFKFSSPAQSFHGRDGWLKGFPNAHKNGPTFEEPKLVDSDDFQVTRKGLKKLAFFTIHIVETYKIDEATGTISEINAAMTKK
jgi:hypothetical protein